jgi:L-2,4-diaminobutyric acid acetyltransferase
MNQRSAPGSSWQLRPPDPGDGAALHSLIKNCPPLDPNSCYAYLLQGLHFADTCVLAEADGTLAGYVSAYLPPNRPDTLFVWQVAVAEAARGQGLARSMLQELLRRPACRALRFLETTVSPGNLASTRLFQGLAQALGCACTVSDLFPAALFGADGHDAERLFRLGPFPAQHTPHRKEELHGHIHLRAP